MATEFCVPETQFCVPGTLRPLRSVTADGFLEFHWEKGWDWKSEMPALGNDDLMWRASLNKNGDNKCMKKPASKSSSSTKLAYSKAYHLAVKKYDQKCIKLNKKPDASERRRLAAEAGRAAAARS